MEAFIELRLAARSRRDKLIEHARAECEKTLKQIDALESVLTANGEPKGPTNVTAIITNTMPTDKAFSVPEIVALLEQNHPWRMWTARAVNSAIQRMMEKKIVKRVGRKRMLKDRKIIHTRYALTGADVAIDDPFPGEVLKDAVYRVLMGRTLTVRDLAIELRALGWRTTATPTGFRNSVANVLRKDSRFTRDGERWSCR